MKTYLVVLVVLTLTLAGQVSAQINEQAALPEGGTVGSVTGPDSTVVPKIIPPPPSTVIPKTYSRPASPSPEWQTRNGTEKAAKRVLQGDFAQRGHRHRQPIKTMIREGHTGHEVPYQEVKLWNPASVSFVEARDQKTLGLTNAYAKGLVDGACKPAATAANIQPPVADSSKEGAISVATQQGKHFPWWLLGILLPLLLVGLIWWWLQNRGPWVTNNGRFWTLRRFIGERQTRVKIVDGCRQHPEKAVKNCSAGDSAWQPKTRAKLGDTLRYRLRIHNTAHTPVPADQVWIHDQPAPEVEFIKESGCSSINNSQFNRCPIPDSMIQQLLTGSILKMSDIPGMPKELPANSSIYLWYDMRVTVDDDGVEAAQMWVMPPAESAKEEIVIDLPPAPEPAPEPVVPVGPVSEPIPEPSGGPAVGEVVVDEGAPEHEEVVIGPAEDETEEVVEESAAESVSEPAAKAGAGKKAHAKEKAAKKPAATKKKPSMEDLAKLISSPED